MGVLPVELDQWVEPILLLETDWLAHYNMLMRINPCTTTYILTNPLEIHCPRVMDLSVRKCGLRLICIYYTDCWGLRGCPSGTDALVIY